MSVLDDLIGRSTRNDCGGLGINIKRDPAELGHSPFQLPDGLMAEMRRGQMSGYRNAYSRPMYGNKVLNPDRPLTGKPQHYLTGLECGCETLTINETGE